MRLVSRGGVCLAGGRGYAAAAVLTAAIGLAVPAGHALDVSGSSVASGLIVDSGANSGNNPMSVFSGGSAINTSIGGGGKQFVAAGGEATATTINSGGSQTVSGGVASNTILNHSGRQFVLSGGTAIDTVINSGGSQAISNGGVASDTSVGSGGTQYVYSGGTDVSTTIDATGWQIVNSGGIAIETVISSGGSQTIYNSGVASGTNISSGGSQFISSGGTAVDAAIDAAGRQKVSSGGIAIGTVIGSSGSQSVSASGVAISTNIDSRGTLYVSRGGTATEIMQNEGGNVWFFVSGTDSATVISGSNASGMFSFESGVASNFIIYSGGEQTIAGGGSAVNTAISAAVQYISAGGFAIDTVIDSRGSQIISNGGVAISTNIGSGGGQYISRGGVASVTNIGSGGIQIVYDSGIASAPSIEAGGRLSCHSGGSVIDIVEPVEGALLGYGAIFGDVTIASGGLLAPGSASDSESTRNYGSMTITGNLTLSSGAIYQTRVDSLGNHDAVIVTGSADVTDATFSHVAVAGANGEDFANTSAMVMSASDGVTGTFGSVTTTLGFFDIELDYSINNEIWFRLARSLSFADYGRSFNQNAIAGGLTSLETLDPSNALILVLLGLNADEVERVYDQLSGEMHPSLAGGLMLLDRDFTHLILNRAGGKSLAGSILAAQAPSFAAARGFASIHPRALESRFGDNFWANVGYARQSVDGDGNAGSYTLKGPEFTLGYHHSAPSGWLGGFAFRYADRDMEVKSRLSEADIDSYSAALYGGFQTAFGPGAARLVLGGAYSRHEVEGRRGVVIGTDSQRLRSDYHANSYQLFLEGAYAIPVGAVWLEPFAELAWTSLHVPGFVETGGNAALRSHSYSRNNLSQLLGLRLVLPSLCRVNVEAQAGWRHTYGKLDKASSLSFAAGGDRFGIKGSTLNRDEAILDLQASYQVRDNLRVGLEANAAVGGRGTNVRGGAFVALEW